MLSKRTKGDQMNPLQNFRNNEKNILSIRFLDLFTSKKMKMNVAKKRTISTLIWFCLILGLFYAHLLIVDEFNKDHIIPGLIAALICAMSLYVINKAFSFTCERIDEIKEKNIFLKESEKVIEKWFNDNVKLKPQIIVVIASALLLTIILITVDVFFSLPFLSHYSLVLIYFITILFLSQGLYWAVVTPFLIKKVYDCGVSTIKAYKPNLNDSVIFLKISKIYSRYMTYIATISTLCLLGIISSTWKSDFLGNFAIISWIFLGYIISLYTLFYPKYLLNKISQRETTQYLQLIQKKINEIDIDNKQLDKNTLSKLESLLTIHDKVIKYLKSPFNFENIVLFIGTIIVPTIIGLLEIIG
jgi:hypothetical protein